MLRARGADVIGVDGSAEMVAAAVARELNAEQMDGHHLTFDTDFDAVFSNAALHWMTRPEAVIQDVARALKPGGCFVGEMGGFGNVGSIVVAILAVLRRFGIDGPCHLPWYFPIPADYQAKLEGFGFTVDRIDLFPRLTPLPTGMDGWLGTFAPWAFELIAEKDRASARDEMVDPLRPVLCDHNVDWSADYVRLRFAARLVPSAKSDSK